MAGRIAVFGLDGASFALFKKYAIELDELPTFRELMERGVSGPLRSTLPPATLPAWDSFVTGKNPGKTGVLSMYTRKPGSYELNRKTAMDRKCLAIWDLVSDSQKRVVIMNVPNTFPPQSVNGVMITGRFTIRGKPYTYPASLDNELNQLLGGDYKINAEPDFTFQDYVELTWQRAKVMKYLIKEKNWDLFIGVFHVLDNICHRFWRDKDKILEYHKVLDDCICDLLTALPDTANVVVMSDHGFTTLEYYFNCNVWLRQNGYLKIKEMPMKARVRNYALSLGRKIVEQGLQILVRTGTRQMVRDLLGIKWRRRLYHQISPRSDFFHKMIDWPNSKAYSLYGNMPHVFLNVKGREPSGCVGQGKEFRDLREQIIREITQIRHPETGKRLRGKVYRKEDLYHGPYVDQAPDFFFTFDDFQGVDMAARVDTNEVFSKIQRGAGCHHPDGLFMAKGPEFKVGIQISGACIIDLTPTILHLMGMGVSNDMDGRVLKEAFSEGGSAGSREVRYYYDEGEWEETKMVKDWSEEEEKMIEERLRGLGYLE